MNIHWYHCQRLALLLKPFVEGSENKEDIQRSGKKLKDQVNIRILEILQQQSFSS